MLISVVIYLSDLSDPQGIYTISFLSHYVLQTLENRSQNNSHLS